MFLRSLATAVPPRAFTQADCWAAISASPAAATLRPRSLGLLEKILTGGTAGIDTRHLALDDIAAVAAEDAGALNRRFEHHAPALAARALHGALDRAGIPAAGLDALIVCTCTGYLCPGVSSHLAEAAGLRADAQLVDLAGLGCGAAIPAMRLANAILAENPDAIVATVAVEICSAAFHADNDPGVLISLCLFGDGAAAALWTGRGHHGDWRAASFDTHHLPQHREKIRFVNAAGRLRNQLDRAVPTLAADAVATLFNRFAGPRPTPIRAHPGGRDVSDALERVLPNQLGATRAVLRTFGNMSSPSLWFALERRLASSTTHDDALWLTAFGAGFAAHSCALLRHHDGRS